MQYTITLLTAGLCALATPVLGALPDRRQSPDVSTITPLPMDLWSTPNIHRVAEPRCDQAFTDLAHLTGTLLSDGMQDGLMEWWSEETEDPLPLLFPACLLNITGRMDTATARQLLAGKFDSIYDDPVIMHKIKMWIGPLGVCRGVIEMTEDSSFDGRGGALHLLVKTAAWLRRRPDGQEKLRKACMIGEASMLDRRLVGGSPCKIASRVLGKEVSSGITSNPWQHGVRKWWMKNQNRLLRLLHNDYHNDTDTEVHGLPKGEYDDIIGMDDPVLLLDKPHCNSVCKELVRIAGASGIHGQWGSFHFMLKAREWMALHPPAVAAWEDACLHRGEHEGRPVKETEMLDARGGVDVLEAIRGRASDRSKGEVTSDHLVTRHVSRGRHLSILN